MFTPASKAIGAAVQWGYMTAPPVYTLQNRKRTSSFFISNQHNLLVVFLTPCAPTYGILHASKNKFKGATILVQIRQTCLIRKNKLNLHSTKLNSYSYQFYRMHNTALRKLELFQPKTPVGVLVPTHKWAAATH